MMITLINVFAKLQSSRSLLVHLPLVRTSTHRSLARSLRSQDTCLLVVPMSYTVLGSCTFPFVAPTTVSNSLPRDIRSICQRFITIQRRFISAMFSMNTIATSNVCASDSTYCFDRARFMKMITYLLTYLQTRSAGRPRSRRLR